MWFLPSYGRPGFAKRLLDAAGGMPDEVVVLLNADDPEFIHYMTQEDEVWPKGWVSHTIPAGSRFCDAYRYVMAHYSDLPWYGMLGDDHVARTPGWHERLIRDAGKYCMAYPNGKHTEFPLMRGVCVIGGELVRAVGWIAPPEHRHNYIDVVWHDIAAASGLLRPQEDLMVDHLHWKFEPGVQQDSTYQRGSVDQADDCVRYWKWVGSPDQGLINSRVSAMALNARREGRL